MQFPRTAASLVLLLGPFVLWAAPLACAADIHIAAGDDLQSALDRARPGDTLLLAFGATFTGNFALPAKSASSPTALWITIQTDVAPSRVTPASPNRVTAPEAASFAKIQTRNLDPAILAAPGSHHYRLRNLEIAAAGIYTDTILAIGSAEERSPREIPKHFELDRLYLHGDATLGAKRGIGLNGADVVVRNSYIFDIKSTDQDTQAICGWNGPGPFQIINNYLEATGENIMFGGAHPALVNIVPSDIEILHNHFTKPLTWYPKHPSYGGVRYMVKNLLELKSARRVRIQGNIFENHWVQSQPGWAIVFTVRSTDEGIPWAVVQDIVFEDNLLKSSAQGIDILGHQYADFAKTPCGPGRECRIQIRNNLFLDIDSLKWSGTYPGHMFAAINNPSDLVIENNTLIGDSGTFIFTGTPTQGFRFARNVSAHGVDGMAGDGKPRWSPALSYYAPNGIVEQNVIFGAPTSDASQHPAGNIFLPDSSNLFVDPAHEDYRLARTFPGNPGVDFQKIQKAIHGVREGTAQEPASRAARNWSKKQ